jgi:hypothetical protein
MLGDLFSVEQEGRKKTNRPCVEACCLPKRKSFEVVVGVWLTLFAAVLMLLAWMNRTIREARNPIEEKAEHGDHDCACDSLPHLFHRPNT